MVVTAKKRRRDATATCALDGGNESKKPRLTKAALAAQSAEALAKQQAAAKKENATKATDTLWGATVRLRTQSDNTWTSLMAPLLTTTAKRFSVPVTTLKDRFKQRLAEASGAELQLSKLRSNAASQFSGYEKRKLYDWLDWKRRYMEPATSLELRAKVCLLVARCECRCGLLSLLLIAFSLLI